jgi:hypothetical protein
MSKKRPKPNKDGKVNSKELDQWLFKKLRKPTAPPTKIFKDKKKYSRKTKHAKKETS